MRKTLPERIDEALAGERVSYGELARRLWSPQSRAWRYSSNGGPPGCYMALSAGLRRGGFFVDYGERGKSNAARLVHPRKSQ